MQFAVEYESGQWGGGGGRPRACCGPGHAHAAVCQLTLKPFVVLYLRD